MFEIYRLLGFCTVTIRQLEESASEHDDVLFTFIIMLIIAIPTDC